MAQGLQEISTPPPNPARLEASSLGLRIGQIGTPRLVTQSKSHDLKDQKILISIYKQMNQRIAKTERKK